jgi:hypothetical protein
MGNEIPEDPYRTIARERSHEEAKQTFATSRMLVQSLILINGGAAIAALAFYGAHELHAQGKLALPLVIILYCLGICIAVFAGLYLRRTNQELSIFWELESYPERQEREKAMEAHRQAAMTSRRWLTGLIVFSELCFLVASSGLAIFLAGSSS